MRLRKYFIETLKLSILFSGLSVSISQLFLFISLILMLIELLTNWQTNARDQSTPSPFKGVGPIFKVSLFLFGIYFLSFFYHSVDNGFNFAYLKSIAKSEIKDIFLFAGFLVMQNLKKEDFPEILKTFNWLMYIIVFTGFISLFSQIRLTRLISDLYTASTSWKFQHHFGTYAGIHFYYPIGMMNTHLTFGGLLLLFYPYAFFRMLNNFLKENFSLHTIYHLLFLGIFTLVFFLNNARSAMLGAMIGILLGIYHLSRYRHNYPFCQIFAKIGLLKLQGLIFILLITLVTVLSGSAKFKRFLTSEKHTDSGRTFIWNSTFPLIQNNLVLGVGPGNYNKEIAKSRLKLAEENPNLLFFYEVTQRGHAHNDFLHLFAIAGIFALIAYLLLSYYITDTLFNMESINDKEHKNQNIKSASKKLYSSEVMQGRSASALLPCSYFFAALFYSLPGFFFAGLLQCYFQDDEVVIVFWFLTGLMNALYATSNIASVESPELTKLK